MTRLRLGETRLGLREPRLGATRIIGECDKANDGDGDARGNDARDARDGDARDGDGDARDARDRDGDARGNEYGDMKYASSALSSELSTWFSAPNGLGIGVGFPGF